MKSLREEIMGAPVELKGKLLNKKIRLTDLAKLKAGDIIPIEMPETVLMLANGIPTFRGKLGEANGNLALKVVSKVERPDSESNKQSPLTWLQELANNEDEQSAQETK